MKIQCGRCDEIMLPIHTEYPENITWYQCLGCGNEIHIAFHRPTLDMEELHNEVDLMTENKKFFSGSISFGALGKKDIVIFKSFKKEKPTSPDWTIMTKDVTTDKLVSIGALWEKEKQGVETPASSW